jgi:predicted transcriptional regulator
MGNAVQNGWKLPKPSEYYPKDPKVDNIKQSFIVQADPELSFFEKTLMTHIVLKSTVNGCCFLKIDELAKAISTQKSRVSKGVTKLMELDYLRIERIPRHYTFYMLGKKLNPDAPKNKDRELMNELEKRAKEDAAKELKSNNNQNHSFTGETLEFHIGNSKLQVSSCEPSITV